MLLYELLDEVVDYGFPQNSSSEALREFVLNEPTVLLTVRLKLGQDHLPQRSVLCAQAPFAAAHGA